MLTSDSRDYELIDRLAEEFAERFRKGERPSVQEYCDKYPHIADDLREMLPALAEVEHIKDEVQAPPVAEMPKLRQIGEYSILREVGRGGMGVVYEAEQVSLGRRVALKVLAGGKSGHGLERFKREARAAARLHHTNIVPVFGVGDHEGLPYYVMQFIQGLGVDEVLEEVKRLQALSGAAVPPSSVSAKAPRKDISAAAVARSLVTGRFEPPPEAIAETLTHATVGQVSNLSGQNGQVGNLSYDKPASSTSSISLPGQSNISGRKPTYWQSVAQIGLQVADALDYAHHQGVLHRDIKPSNLLLDLHGVVWVTDFGLAKADDQENLTHTGDMLGTLRYMPPEAFEGKNDARSDVYSLGLSMYELLALRPAYDERKREQLIKQVTSTDPPRLGSLNRAIPRDLQTIVHKAIEKDPEHRYKSAGELAADLRRYLSDQPILARRIHPVERFGRWCKRNPTVAGLSTAVFLLLAAVATVSSVLAVRIDQKAAEAQEATERTNIALIDVGHERDRNKELAEIAKKETANKNDALEAEAKEKQRTQELLGEQFVYRGAQLLTEGDIAGAALCYAQALKLDPFDKERALTHRIRLTAALRDAPRPRHILFNNARVLVTAISHDCKLLAAGCDDNKVYIWDLTTGERVGQPLAHEREIHSLAFAAGGKKVWALTKGKEAIEPEFDPETGFETMGTSSYETYLWDWETAKKEFSGIRHFTTTFPVFDPVNHKEWVANLPKPNVLEVLDRDTGKPIGPPIEVKEQIVWCSGSLHTNRIVVSTMVPAPPKDESGARPVRLYEFRVFDATTGKPVYETVRSGRSSVDFCGTNERYFVLTDPATGVAQWYDVATGAKGPSVTKQGWLPNAVVITPDRRRVIITFVQRGQAGIAPSRRAATIHIADADTGKEVVAPFAQTSTTFSSGGMRLTPRPNLDASRFVMEAGDVKQLLNADGSAVASQPEGISASTRFSPDGGYLLTVGIDNMVRVWGAWTGGPVGTRMPHNGPVRSAEFTPDGSHVVAVCGSAVWVWPLVRVDQGHGLVLSNTRDRALSADGSRILEHTSLNDTSVLDATTGKVVAGPVALPILQNDQGWRTSIGQLRPDGRAAVYSLRAGGGPGGGKGALTKPEPSRVVLWNCDMVKLIDLLDVMTLAPIVAEFSADGRFVRTVLLEGNDVIHQQLWDASTGAAQGVGVRITRPIKAGSKSGRPTVSGRGDWSPDSALVVYRDTSTADLPLRVCDARTGAEVAPPIEFDGSRNVALQFDASSERLLTVQIAAPNSPKGSVVVPKSAMSGRLQLWDLRSGKPIGPPVQGSQLGGNITSATLNAAGDRIAVDIGTLNRTPRTDTGGLGVYLWDPAAGKLATPPLHHAEPVRRTRFSVDGQWLLTATLQRIHLWSTATGELVHLIPVTDNIDEAEFSHDGRRIVVATSRRSQIQPGGGPGGFSTTSMLQIWDVRTGQPLTPPLQAKSIRFRNGPAENARDWSRNADRLLINGENGTAGVYSLVGDDRPIEDLLALAEVLSTRQVNTAGVVQGTGPADFRKSWDAVRQRFASEWSAAPIEGDEWSERMIPDRQNRLQGAVFPIGPGLPERAGQLLWHVDRLLVNDPDNPGLHLSRGQSLARRGDSAAAETALTRALDLNANNSAFAYRLRAGVRIDLENWEGAESDLVESLRLAPDGAKGPLSLTSTGPVYGSLALLRLQRGNIEGYRAACAKLPLPPTTNQGAALGPRALIARNLWPALLVDGVLPKIKEVYPEASDLQFSVGFSNAFGGSGGEREGPFCMEMVLRYRQGRYEEAEALLTAREASPNRADHYVLAMIQFKLGKAEARATLDKANAMKSEQTGPGIATGLGFGFGSAGLFVNTWQRKLIDDTLQKEAEGMILGKK